MIGSVWLERLAQDLRYGCRMLARNPGFTVVAILSLAIVKSQFTIYNSRLIDHVGW